MILCQQDGGKISFLSTPPYNGLTTSSKPSTGAQCRSKAQQHQEPLQLIRWLLHNPDPYVACRKTVSSSCTYIKHPRGRCKTPTVACFKVLMQLLPTDPPCTHQQQCPPNGQAIQPSNICSPSSSISHMQPQQQAHPLGKNVAQPSFRTPAHWPTTTTTLVD